VSTAVHALNDVVAELLERLANVTKPRDACSIVLDRVLPETGFAQALLLVRNESGVLAVGWSVSDTQVAAAREAAHQEDSAVCRALARGHSPELLSGRIPRALNFASPVAIPFPGVSRTGFGVLLVDSPALDQRIEVADALLRRIGPTLNRCLQLDAATNRALRLDRQRDLLTGIMNALTDPVVLTNSENDILLTNQRAEQLFIYRENQSEGRRRAVQVNNLLFSSFLTQAVIGGKETARELNLVDPVEGSDLLFEVLSVSVASGLEGSVISILRDITDLKRAVSQLEVEFRRSRSAEHQARQERDRLNVVLENVSDPILLTDENSNIILMNPEADRLFVVPPGADLETPWARLVQANDTRFTTLISDFLLQADHRRVEHLNLVDPDTGREFPADVGSTKIFNARGEPIAIVSVLHDQTQYFENQRLARELQLLNEQLEQRIDQATNELAERNRQLEWQRAEIEKASRLKSEFLAAMSHELRTPLNVIIGYSSLMRERIYGELTSTQDETLGHVLITSQHLLQLINSVLDLSRIEAGKMPLHIEEIDLPLLVAEVAETIAPMVNRKQLSFAAEVNSDLPHLLSDSTKLKQVLLNLLSNAIKFTREGGILLSVERLDLEHVRFCVADTGIGIKSEHLHEIFEHFRQLDQTHTREYGGTGLGLTITQNLLVLLGGTISVESTYGSGSRFIVELPCQFSAARRTSDAGLRTSGGSSDVSMST
jgi:signal transduction histidine kinase